jgi:4-hydroxyphenylpyruvate dioxygenase
MDAWAGFYERLFNFREIRYFDIEGKLHRAEVEGADLALRPDPHPDQRIERRPLADRGVPARLWRRGHPAHRHGTTDIYGSVEGLRGEGVRFLDTPDTYYELLPQRLPDTGEDMARMARNRILMDGSPSGGRLLQIFTETVIGPIFFELIQRKGDQGFGEGNFRALFESIELDQVRRGVLKPAAE